MTHLKTLVIALGFVTLPTTASEDQTDRWYMSNTENPTVQVSTGGSLFAFLGRDGNKVVRLYFVRPDENVCKTEGAKDVRYHPPIYIGSTAIKLSQYCNDRGFLHFMAKTEKGNSYIIKQFLNKMSVTFKTIDDTYLRFSAKGFNKMYYSWTMENKAI